MATVIHGRLNLSAISHGAAVNSPNAVWGRGGGGGGASTKRKRLKSVFLHARANAHICLNLTHDGVFPEYVEFNSCVRLRWMFGKRRKKVIG